MDSRLPRVPVWSMLMVAAAGVWFALCSPCQANGYRVLCLRDAKATAMGEAFLAQADDPSALAFNPAGLAQLDGMKLSLQGTVCNAYTERDAAGGGVTGITDGWQFVPALYASSDFGLENAAFGLGVSIPNGLSSEWGRQSFARYSATYSDLFVADVAVGAGVRLNDKLMVGATVDYYYSDLTYERMVFPPAVGLPFGPDILNRMKGSGDAWGFSLGLLWEVAEKHRVALAYHHSFTIDYDGKNRLRGVAVSDMNTSIDFPAVISAGYAYLPTDRWTIEFDVDWTNWEKVDSLTVESGGSNLVQRQDFNNTFTYKLGTQYQWSECLALRAGYIYNQNATPDSTWGPSLPDTVSHFFTGGFGYTIGPVTIDTALQLVLYETRTIDNSPDVLGINGTYRNWAPCLSVGLTYAF